MREIVDEKISSMLGKDEKIVDRYFDNYRNITWFATNKKIIKYCKTFFGPKKVVELPYKYITSITFDWTSFWWVLVISGFLMIFGFIFMKNLKIGFAGFSVYIGFMGFFVGLAGILLLPLGFVKSASYKFTGAGIDQKEWTIEHSYFFGTARINKMRSFINEIRKHLPD